MNLDIGFNMFRLRQLTGIPFTKLIEISAFLAYEHLKDNPELTRDIVQKYAIRKPEKQIEIDRKRGYQSVI